MFGKGIKRKRKPEPRPTTPESQALGPTPQQQREIKEQLAGLPTFEGFRRMKCKCQPGERRWRVEAGKTLCLKCGGEAPDD